MDRRHALELLGSMAAAPALARLERHRAAELLAIGARAHEAPPDAARILTPDQYAAVANVAEHIIPRTDTPGATDARVADFVDVMLADWYAPDERERFLRGLDDLDARAHARRGTPFNDAAPADQQALVRALDDEVAALRRRDGRAANEHWFGMLKFLTVWGYCTSRIVAASDARMTGRYDGDAPYRIRGSS